MFEFLRFVDCTFWFSSLLLLLFAFLVLCPLRVWLVWLVYGFFIDYFTHVIIIILGLFYWLLLVCVFALVFTFTLPFRFTFLRYYVNSFYLIGLVYCVVGFWFCVRWLLIICCLVGSYVWFVGSLFLRFWFVVCVLFGVCYYAFLILNVPLVRF